MIKRNKILIIISGTILISILIFAANYFQVFEGNNWKPPKFVKEWEIKEITPGIKQEIISLTANQYGIFALIKATEKIMLQKPDKPEEMSEKAKNEFLFNYSPFSAEALLNMSAEEKNSLFDFMIKHIIPVRKAIEISEAEKQEIMNFLLQYKEKEPEINKNLFRMNLQKLGRDKVIDDIMDAISSQETEEIYHFRIQHYNFEGIFINQWLENNRIEVSNKIKDKKSSLSNLGSNNKHIFQLDPNERIINPLFIRSDDNGNIYMVDFDGNKIVKFNQKGELLKLWRIDIRKSVYPYSYFESENKGFTITNDNIYLISKGFNEKFGTGPKIIEFNLNGEIIKEKVIKPLRIQARIPEIGFKIPFMKQDGLVRDLAANRKGDLYLFTGENALILNNKWEEIKYFSTILRRGFEKPKPVYDPEFKKMRRYDQDIRKRYGVNFYFYDTDKLASKAGDCLAYCANSITSSPKNELFITFLGPKIFGTIDAMIFGQDGKMIGYWKNNQKSYSPWFQNLLDVQKIETADIRLDIAFYQNIIIMGRTFHIGRTRNQYKNIMQKFFRED